MLATIGLAGCADPAEPFSCTRGLHATDWKKRPIRTADSIAACGWLDGMRREDVIALLGKPHEREAAALRWLPALEEDWSIGDYVYVDAVFADDRVIRVEVSRN